MRTTGLRGGGLRSTVMLLAVGAAAHGEAGTLEVSIVDEQGRPIADVAVYATPAHAVAEHAATGAAVTDPAALPAAAMDQRKHQFVPHMLVVQSGTEVTFPNSDTVSHHVYSFSDTKTFELPLYKGDVYPPVVFDRPGIVVVGCNIHDGMLGYVFVVDTPHYALTDEQGVASLEVPDGEYVVNAWTPRARSAGLPAAQHVAVAGAAAVEARVTGRLAPAHDHGRSSLTWERY